MESQILTVLTALAAMVAGGLLVQSSLKVRVNDFLKNGRLQALEHKNATTPFEITTYDNLRAVLDGRLGK